MDKESYYELYRLVASVKNKVYNVMQKERIGYHERGELSAAVCDIGAIESSINRIFEASKAEVRGFTTKNG